MLANPNRPKSAKPTGLLGRLFDPFVNPQQPQSMTSPQAALAPPGGGNKPFNDAIAGELYQDSPPFQQAGVGTGLKASLLKSIGVNESPDPMVNQKMQQSNMPNLSRLATMGGIAYLLSRM